MALRGDRVVATFRRAKSGIHCLRPSDRLPNAATVETIATSITKSVGEVGAIVIQDQTKVTKGVSRG